ATESGDAVDLDPTSRILRQTGHLDEATYGRLIERALQTGERPSEILQRTGVVTAAQIHDACRRHLLEQLLQLFKLQEVEFALYRQDHDRGRDETEVGRRCLHPRLIVFYGVRSSYEPDRIQRELTSTMGGRTFRIDPTNLAALDRYNFA